MKEDRQLQDAFQRARAADAEAAPSVDAVLTRGRGPKRLWFPVAAVAVTLSAAVIAFWPAPPAGPPPSLTEWRSPTAFLLEYPGGEFLRQTPRVHRPNEEVLLCENCF